MSALAMDVTATRLEIRQLESFTQTRPGLRAFGSRQQPASMLVGTALLLGTLTGTGTMGLPEPSMSVQYLGVGTSTARAVPGMFEVRAGRSAFASSEAPELSSDRDGVLWLHEQSGLTWDQLGRLFGVSRRTVHLWASGSGMNAANAETLFALVNLVSKAEGRTPGERRAALLRPGSGGRSAIDGFRLARGAVGQSINAPTLRPEVLLDARYELSVTEV
jgi:hypothetical protein